MAGDGLSEDGSVGRHEVDEAVRESGLFEDLVDPVVGQDGRVTRLPDNAVTLKEVTTYFYSQGFVTTVQRNPTEKLITSILRVTYKQT